MVLEVTVEGIGGMEAQLERLRKEIGPRALAVGMYAAANEVLNDAKDTKVPIDEGPLVGSGYVTLPDPNDRIPIIEIGFGGAAKEYAENVHEDLEAFHEVGQAKYLEAAMAENFGRLTGIIASRGRAAFESGRGVRQAPGVPTDPNRGGV